MAGSLPQRRLPADSPQHEELRERLVNAVSKVAAEQGYSRLTLDQVTRYAGVSPATFEEHFASKEQGLIAAQDAFLTRLQLEVASACEAESSWPMKVRAALRAILGSLVETSSLARVFAIEAAAASIAATERQFATLDDFAALLSDGRELYPRAASLPDAAERALVGGIASIVSGRLLAEDPQALVALEPQLVELVLTPYLGHAEAKRIAAA
jgi:AcrR family transcriptional regulator